MVRKVFRPYFWRCPIGLKARGGIQQRQAAVLRRDFQGKGGNSDRLPDSYLRLPMPGKDTRDGKMIIWMQKIIKDI
jgi:hypothetical protein